MGNRDPQKYLDDMGKGILNLSSFGRKKNKSNQNKSRGKGWHNQPTRHALASKGIETTSKGWAGHNEGTFTGRDIGLAPTFDDVDDYEQVGSITTFGNDYKIYRYDGGSSHRLNYYLVKDLEEFINADRQDKSNQEISHFVDGILFLNGGKAIRIVESELDEELQDRILETDNGLLEDAISLGRGADMGLADQKVLFDVKKLKIYEELDDIGEGLLQLGLSGSSYGIMLGETFNGKDKIILEKVKGYPEGYIVSRKEIPVEFLEVMNDDVVKKIKEKIK